MMGFEHGLLPPDEAANFELSSEAKQNIASYSRGCYDGTPQQVHDWIVERAKGYQTKDIGLVTNCYSFEARVKSYRLISESFGLTPCRGPAPS